MKLCFRALGLEGGKDDGWELRSRTLKLHASAEHGLEGECSGVKIEFRRTEQGLGKTLEVSARGGAARRAMAAERWVGGSSDRSGVTRKGRLSKRSGVTRKGRLSNRSGVTREERRGFSTRWEGSISGAR